MNKKKAVWGFLSLGIAILTIMMIASGSKEFSLDTMMVYLSRANKLWLAAGLLCMFGYIWFEGYALVHICRTLGYQSAKRQVMGDELQNIYYKSETTLPYKADLRQENGFILGGDADDVAVENGLKFHIDWLRGQKTGFFVDQRENRSLLEHYAKGKSVLNMFCYTGGFSVYAMRGNAKAVHSVDSSAKAIELTNENIALNFPGDPRHEAFCEDAFKYLDEHDQQYDLIILDPPAFAKHRAALRNALKGYTRLNVKGLQRIKKGGILFTFSCSQVVTKDNFRNAVFTAAA